MRHKRWQVLAFWIGIGVLVVVAIVLAAANSRAAAAVAVGVAIVALVVPYVQGAVGQRPRLVLKATTAGSTTTEEQGVRVARVGVQLGLHNVGGEARSWKIEVSTAAPGALNLYRAAPPQSDAVIERQGTIVWQSAPGEPLAHDAERQLDLHTGLFPIAGGMVRAKLMIKADRASPRISWLEVRARQYSSSGAKFEATITEDTGA